MRKRTIRLALAITLLGCIPTLLFAAFSYRGVSERVRDRQVAFGQQSLQQYSAAIERLLSNTIVSMDAFIQSSSRQEAMLLDMTGEDFQTYRAITTELSRLQPVEATQANACLISVRGGWLINNSGLYRLDEAECADKYRAYIDRAISSGVFSYFPEEEDSAARYDSFFAHPAIHLLKGIPRGNRASGGGILLVKLPCSSLSSFLSIEDGIGEVFVLDGDGRIVADSTHSLYGEDMSGSETYERILSKGTRSDDFALEDSGVEVIYRYSDYNGWLYVLLAPTDSLLAEYYSLGMMIVAAFIVLMLVLLGASYLLSRKTYQPVKSLVHTLAQQGDYKPGEEPFAYISTGIDNMTQRHKELMTQLSQQEQPIREYTAIQLLKGLLTREMLKRRARMLGDLCEDDLKTVVVLQLDAMVPEENNDSSGVFMLSMRRLTAELFAGEYILTPVLMDNALCLILSYPERDEEGFMANVKRTCTRLLSLPDGSQNTNSVIGVGEPFRGLEDAARSYQEACRALSQSIFYQGETILFYGSLTLTRSLRPHLYLRTQDRLITAVKSADEESAQRLLDQLFDDIFREELSRSEYIVPLLNLLTELIVLRQDISGAFSTRQENGRSIYDEFLSLRTQQEMRNWLLDRMITPYMQEACRIFDTRQRQLVRSIKQMIEEQFDKGITLESCADELNYHPAHIRKVFQEVTGLSFSDYLNRRRMEAAKEWLCDSQMQIQEIAERLSYSNSQNFIRSFRAYTGQTPGSYRRQNRRGGS